MRDAGLEFTIATLSGLGLSAPEIALAEAIAEPGQTYGEVAVLVRRRITRIRSLMLRNGLFARTRSQRFRAKREQKEKEDGADT